MAEPYRRTYGVEDKIRSLTQEEAALVSARRDAWHADVRKRELAGTKELVVPILVSAAAVAVGLATRNHAVLVVGGLMAVFFLALVGIARRKARERIAAAKGPWDAPEGGWHVRETIVVARSVVGAVSGDEDYTSWLLFEIPGGEWFFVEPLCLPDLAQDLAREQVRIASLDPDGFALSVDVSGETIPHRSASVRPDDYPDAVERGFVWRPDDDAFRGNGFGMVAEERLPGWMRERG